MPDLMRIGGVTGWLRAAAIAGAAGVPVSTHLYPEIAAHLMRVTETAHWLEWQDLQAGYHDIEAGPELPLGIARHADDGDLRQPGEPPLCQRSKACLQLRRRATRRPRQQAGDLRRAKPVT